MLVSQFTLKKNKESLSRTTMIVSEGECGGVLYVERPGVVNKFKRRQEIIQNIYRMMIKEALIIYNFSQWYLACFNYI